MQTRESFFVVLAFTTTTVMLLAWALQMTHALS